MSLVAGFWIWRDHPTEGAIPGTLALDSPISLPKVIWFGVLFITLQVAGTLLTRMFGSRGMLATGFFGGFVSSASTTAAAATMAMHGKISAALAGSATVLTSLASAAVNLPIVWRMTNNKGVVRRLTLEMSTIIATGICAVALDRFFQISELLVRR
jgi:uncharacterized membrane protein (DUF4010 family)